MQICTRDGRRAGCLPPGPGVPVKGSPRQHRSPGRLSGRKAPSSSAPGRQRAQKGSGAEGLGCVGDLTLLGCYTLMGMENVNFLCIPGTIHRGGDL